MNPFSAPPTHSAFTSQMTQFSALPTPAAPAEVNVQGKGSSKVLKIVSWNVAGLQACLSVSFHLISVIWLWILIFRNRHDQQKQQKGLEVYLERSDPDIICLQETKIAANNPKLRAFDKYHVTINEAQNVGYSGTGFAIDLSAPVKFHTLTNQF